MSNCLGCGDITNHRFCLLCLSRGRDEAYERGLAEGRAEFRRVTERAAARAERAEIASRAAGAYESAANQQYFADCFRAGYPPPLYRGTSVQFLHVTLDGEAISLRGDLGDEEFLGTVADYLKTLAIEIQTERTRSLIESAGGMAACIADLMTQIKSMAGAFCGNGSPKEIPSP